MATVCAMVFSLAAAQFCAALIVVAAIALARSMR
jgi:hypothetical protein